MTKHTPGKWSASSMTIAKADWAALHSGKHTIDIVKRGADVIAAVWCGDDKDGEEKANARLIAAAPFLLQTLETLALHAPSLDAAGIREYCDAAIAKAEGRA